MSTRNCRAGISMSQADEEIRGLEMLRRDTEAAVAAISKDPWQQWLLHHGLDVIVAADLNEWEKACLKCIVRHSGYSGVIPQEWLFDGGPDGDPILEELSCLPGDTRRKRITRLVNKIDKLCRETNLSWKVERAADCSKTIGTASRSSVTMHYSPVRKRR